MVEIKTENQGYKKLIDDLAIWFPTFKVSDPRAGIEEAKQYARMIDAWAEALVHISPEVARRAVKVRLQRGELEKAFAPTVGQILSFVREDADKCLPDEWSGVREKTAIRKAIIQLTLLERLTEYQREDVLANRVIPEHVRAMCAQEYKRFKRRVVRHLLAGSNLRQACKLALQRQQEFPLHKGVQKLIDSIGTGGGYGAKR